MKSEILSCNFGYKFSYFLKLYTDIKMKTKNEPVLNYSPNSNERSLIKNEYERMSSETINIPLKMFKFLRTSQQQTQALMFPFAVVSLYKLAPQMIPTIALHGTLQHYSMILIFLILRQPSKTIQVNLFFSNLLLKH